MRVEVRVPTFRRPELLRRALSTIISQTHTEWRAFVIDDSSGREGESIVNELGDSRICYRFNPSNLGRVANLNFAFGARPFDSSCNFACVLEDDNYWEPRLLEANLAALINSNLPILTRGYRIEDMDESGRTVPNPSLPVHSLWGNASRSIQYSERVSESFFSFTLGNFGYFWDLSAGLDISCRQEMHDVHIAETMRSVSFRGDCWYEPDVLSTFTRFVSKKQTPEGERKFSSTDARKARFSELRFLRFLYTEWTVKLGNQISDLEQIARKRGRINHLTLQLIDAGNMSYILKNKSMRVGLRVIKNLLLWIIHSRSRKRYDQEIMN